MELVLDGLCLIAISEIILLALPRYNLQVNIFDKKGQGAVSNVF